MEYLYEETTVYLILFVVAFFASLIDSIAGGGGLLTTPSMLLVGIPPLNVLATNKFQSCFGTFTSTYNYYRNGLLVEKKKTLYFALSFIGSSIGTLLVSRISNETLESIIPILLIGAAIFFITSVVLSIFFAVLSAMGFLLTIFTLWFFRDPERNTPQDSNLIISSADGKVCLIDEAYPPEELLMDARKMKRICVFMNVFNVHVNRSPISGLAENIVYKKGQFLNASLDKASDKNERSSLIINSANGTKIVVVQIAGLIARRILGFISLNHNLAQGERFGLIRFGSRVDIYMPLDAISKCKVGDKVTAGESVLASFQ